MGFSSVEFSFGFIYDLVEIFDLSRDNTLAIPVDALGLYSVGRYCSVSTTVLRSEAWKGLAGIAIGSRSFSVSTRPMNYADRAFFSIRSHFRSRGQSALLPIRV